MITSSSAIAETSILVSGYCYILRYIIVPNIIALILIGNRGYYTDVFYCTQLYKLLYIYVVIMLVLLIKVWNVLSKLSLCYFELRRYAFSMT